MWDCEHVLPAGLLATNAGWTIAHRNGEQATDISEFITLVYSLHVRVRVRACDRCYRRFVRLTFVIAFVSGKQSQCCVLAIHLGNRSDEITGHVTSVLRPIPLSARSEWAQASYLKKIVSVFRTRYVAAKRNNVLSVSWRLLHAVGSLRIKIFADASRNNLRWAVDLDASVAASRGQYTRLTMVCFRAVRATSATTKM